MPSRIRIGPDGGPYVIVEENNGDLDITTPDNTIDLQNSGLINAALSGVLDAQNNDISNVGALTADSVSTEEAIINGQVESIDIEHLDRVDTSVDGPTTLSLSVGGYEKYLIQYKIRQILSSGDFELRVNGQADGNGIWGFFDETGAKSTGDGIPLVTINSNAFWRGSGVIKLSDAFAYATVSHDVGMARSDRVDGFAQTGGTLAALENSISQVDFILPAETTKITLNAWGVVR